ncbi:thioredoxin domain-containing protein [Brevibacillus sp. SYSU BS000544]|uniref:thioredoxin domain-containing protein n=1 Tax=Brevibacillus sp. SYSU BS000544 TaxID=3416443 RepID=UPI003CE48B5E
MSKSSTLNRKLVIFTTVIVMLMLGLFLMTNSQKAAQTVAVDNQKEFENQPFWGNADAPVTIVELGDYKCPSCKYWTENIFPQLKQDFLDSGKAKLVYVNVLFHGEESTLASLAAESVFAQDPEAYKVFHKEVYAKQPEQTNHDSNWVTKEVLLDIAKTHTPSIDLKKLEQDIDNQTAKPQLEIDNTLVEKFKVEKTPTVVVNGTILEDPFDYDMITSLVNKALEGKK